MMFKITDADGVAALQRESARVYAIARDAYATGQLAETVVGLQQAALATDAMMVKAWGYLSLGWVRPGDEVSDRGLVYAPPILGPYNHRFAVYTSSNAGGSYTWLSVEHDGNESVPPADAAAHCSRSDALEIADALNRYAATAPGDTFAAQPVTTSYGHKVTIGNVPEFPFVSLTIEHDGSRGSDPVRAVARIERRDATALAKTLIRFGDRENTPSYWHD